MSYKHDIFISYSHRDNKLLPGDEHGWVDDFHTALSVQVGHFFGKDPNIWRDPALTGNADFSADIHHQLPDAALLVIIVDKPYLLSAWCKDELDAFVKACDASGGLTIGDKARVFKVLRYPLDDKEVPDTFRPFMRKFLGYPFYSLDPQSLEVQEAWPTRRRDLYFDRIDKLASDIAKLLDRMSRPDAADANSGKPIIYLADTTHDLQEQQSTLRRDLERRGYTVLPSEPLPLEIDQLTAFVQEQLSRSAISVHIVGARYGIIPEGSTVSLIEGQNLLAQQRAKQGSLIRLVWLPSPAHEITDQQNLAFIKRLREDGGWSEHADLLETSFESFRTALDERLHVFEKPPQPEPVAAANLGLAHIYLIADELDRDAAQSVFNYLYDKNFEVSFPLFPSAEPDAAKRLADHRENLKRCDAAVIFYGAAGEAFLRQALRDLSDSAGERVQKPLRSKAICIAPPITAGKQGYRTREALLIDQANGLQPENWAPFLLAMKVTA